MEVPRPMLSISNVKIFVLYLMRNVNYPMDFTTINDIVMQNDFIDYLDFSDAFHQMLEGDLIAISGKDDRGEPLYVATQKGAIVAEQLHSEILPSLLDQALRCALRYLDFRRRNITVETAWDKLADMTTDVTLTLLDHNKVIFKTTLNLDSEIRARRICEKFRETPETAYRGMLALLSGNVDYLLDNRKESL